jgi:23S rRNA pseudouridine1911/1915/1917 synthase
VPSGSDARRFEVPASLDGRPLDRALRELATLSWGDARTLIARGKVKVRGAVTTQAEHRVSKGDTVEIDPRAQAPKRASRLERSALVFVDPHIVVVNKPAGVSTVPYEEGERGTLDQLVAALLPRARGKGPPAALGVVQRLDKETTGLIVFARSFAAKKVLASQLRAHTMHRRYLALAHGQVEARTFRSYLVKDRGDGLRGTSRFGQEGQLAVTHVEPVRVFEKATLVACRLQTGRTHQIRIHLAEAGHPILGERVYIRDYEGELIPARRPMLHAAELGFVHPVKGTPLRFEAEAPADFQEALRALSGSSGAVK